MRRVREQLLTHQKLNSWYRSIRMIFNLSEIEQSRGVGTLRYLPEVGSTSDEARRIVDSTECFREPLLVLCERQTAGRGQLGKTWYSDFESLTFTWCVSENSVPLAVRPLLSLVAGLCVCEAIEALGIAGAKLKWPNDVLLGRRKVCGVLVEKILADEALFLIGIGLNVQQNSLEQVNLQSINSPFPATSLRRYTGAKVAQHDLLLSIVDKLQEVVCGSEFRRVPDLQARFDFLGERIRFVLPNESEILGEFCGVDELGMALIQHDAGIESYASGHIVPAS